MQAAAAKASSLQQELEAQRSSLSAEAASKVADAEAALKLRVEELEVLVGSYREQVGSNGLCLCQ